MRAACMSQGQKVRRGFVATGATAGPGRTGGVSTTVASESRSAGAVIPSLTRAHVLRERQADVDDGGVPEGFLGGREAEGEAVGARHGGLLSRHGTHSRLSAVQ